MKLVLGGWGALILFLLVLTLGSQGADSWFEYGPGPAPVLPLLTGAPDSQGQAPTLVISLVTSRSPFLALYPILSPSPVRNQAPEAMLNSFEVLRC